MVRNASGRASISSAAPMLATEGTGLLARAAGGLALGIRERHVRRIDLLRRQYAKGEGEPPLPQAGAELGRLAILSVGQNAAEPGT